MKGDNNIIKLLNTQLTNELSAINQYFLHARMYRHWGLEKIAKKEYEESIGEMKHADKLINRILMLEGLPNLQALHKLIFSGTLARFPDLKLMAVHGGGYLPGYSGRIDHAWGARQDSHGDLPLPPTTYLRQIYLDTVVFTYHQLAYMLDLFGPDRILMGTDYPFDMAEYNPVGHIAGVDGMDETTLAQLAGGNAARVLGLKV